ncbi:MAG: cysteine protease StiP family protein [Eubacteriales bacterium]
MKSSYDKKDVTILLKDITGLVTPLPAKEREKLIQSGKHYSQMLPLEYVPSDKYIEIYEKTLSVSAKTVANAVATLAKKLLDVYDKNITLVSLARAGTPIGILLKRYMIKKYAIHPKHYTISIIRDRGIDKNAIDYILKNHSPYSIVFVDGWVGKGAILKELKLALSEFEGISDNIAVLADPAHVTSLCGTHEDILIPSACLNCTVCGLISRTYLDDSIIKPDDFHGAIYYEEFEKDDRSNSFLAEIEKHFNFEQDCINLQIHDLSLENTGLEETKNIAANFDISDINMIKPGIGETTRVLLRRVPYKILINPNFADDSELAHVYQLAKEKNVPIEYYKLINYKCVGIIKKLSDI